MENNKLLQIVEMRLRNIPYSSIAFQIGEDESAVRYAARRVVNCLNRSDMHKRTEQAIEEIPYVNIVKYMRDNVLSIRDFSRMCDVTPQYMCMALKNKNGMPVQHASRISKITGMSLSEVYCMAQE